MMLPTAETEDWKKKKKTYQNGKIWHIKSWVYLRVTTKLCKINLKITLQGNLNLNCSTVPHQTFQGINFSRKTQSNYMTTFIYILYTDEYNAYLRIDNRQLNVLHSPPPIKLKRLNIRMWCSKNSDTYSKKYLCPYKNPLVYFTFTY